MHVVFRAYGIFTLSLISRCFVSIFLKIMVILSCESKYEAEEGTRS